MLTVDTAVISPSVQNICDVLVNKEARVPYSTKYLRDKMSTDFAVFSLNREHFVHKFSDTIAKSFPRMLTR